MAGDILQQLGIKAHRLQRLARIFLKPGVIRSVGRMEYRRAFGIPRDKKNRLGFSAWPTNVTLALTYRCNLRCVMCRQIKQENLHDNPAPWYDTKNEMAPEQWINILEQVRHFHPVIYLTGGEPTLYPHFLEVVTAAKAMGLFVQLQTNGTRLEKLADDIVRLGIEAVTVSVDGPPAVHDHIRNVPGCHDLIRRGVAALHTAQKKYKRANPLISFNFTISKDNYPYMVEAVHEAHKMGVDALQFQHTMFNTPENVCKHNEFFGADRNVFRNVKILQPSIGPYSFYESKITEEDIPAIQASLDKARKACKERNMILTVMPDIPKELLKPYYLDIKHPFVHTGCNFFWKTIRVTPDGNFSPCLNFTLGNFKEQSVAELWNNENMQELRRFFVDRIAPGCARCCQRSFNTASRAF